MASSKISVDSPVLLNYLRRWVPPRPLLKGKGRSLINFDMYRFSQLSVWCKSPMTHVEDMLEWYPHALSDVEKLQARISNLALIMSPDPEKAATAELDDFVESLSKNVQVPLPKIHAQFQTSQTMMLTVAIFLNATLRAIEDPLDLNTKWKDQALWLTEEVFTMGETMMHLRPLYAVGLSVTIVVAWGAETDPVRRARLEHYMNLYNSASTGEDWWHGARWFEEYLARWRKEAIALLGQEEAHEDDVEVVKPDGERIYCELESDKPIGRCTIL